MSKEKFDICIVGAGAAGIILAIELSRSLPELSILLIEYGSQDKCTFGNNSLDDSINIENLTNHHPAEECTNKGLGGTTNTWGGRCVMYDPIDFIPRPIVGEQCTWDTTFLDACEPFVSRAQDYFECSGPFVYPRDHPPIAEGFHSDVITDGVLELWSMPTRFGNRYREQLCGQSSIQTLFDTEVLEIREASDGECSVLARSTTQTSEDHAIKARRVILANGAFEATRVLLRSDRLFESIGGRPNSLGKFYQGHVSGKIASVEFTGDPKKTEYGFTQRDDGTYVRRRFQLTTESLVEKNLLNTAIWLDNPLYVDPAHGSGVMSFMYLAMITPWLGRKLGPPAMRHSVTKGKIYKIHRHLLNVITGLPNSLLIPATTFWKRYCRKRKLPGVFLYSPTNTYALHFHGEQVPCETNRLELDPKTDTLVVHYELTDADVKSVIETHIILDEELQATNAGKLKYWFPHDDLPARIREMSRDGVHQNGTTRIASSPELGVVDTDLKVFGTNNIYVCSSSCFPTSGQANPTFFIGVIAVRLAEHLARTIHASN